MSHLYGRCHHLCIWIKDSCVRMCVCACIPMCRYPYLPVHAHPLACAHACAYDSTQIHRNLRFRLQILIVIFNKINSGCFLAVFTRQHALWLFLQRVLRPKWELGNITWSQSLVTLVVTQANIVYWICEYMFLCHEVLNRYLGSDFIASIIHMYII